MKCSETRILTTHAGSLPRPGAARDAILSRARGQTVPAERLSLLLRRAVRDVVRKQVEAGVDVVSDGDISKPSYVTYAADRLTGFTTRTGLPTPSDLADYPGFARRVYERHARAGFETRACTGEVRYRGEAALSADLTSFRAALEGVRVEEAFVSAASPGVIALFSENRHYPTHEQYVHAISDAMRAEYQAIHDAGFLLSLDCPDLAMGRHVGFPDLDLPAYRRIVRLHVEALNEATRDIPAHRMRLHLCWGNYAGPHHHDVPLADIVDLVLEARPAGVSFAASNPRHAHEVSVWSETSVPDDKILIPGVIDTTTNFIEHPELVEQRILSFATIVGRERVIAGTDCGFASMAGSTEIDSAIAYAKLNALSDGAKRASQRLYSRAERASARHARSGGMTAELRRR